MPEPMVIGDRTIKRGETAQIILNIARLPSHTVINLPVNVLRSKKKGPTLLLTGGVHGDELNGIEICRRMIAERRLRPLAGTIIIVPVVNIYGFLNASRALPDGKDLNRSFPGSKTGSLARRLAHAVSAFILPHVDCGIDFHTGGASRTNHPQVRCSFDRKDSLALAKVFGCPFIVHSRERGRSLRTECAKRGIPILTYEGGESLRFDDEAIDAAIAGTMRVMRHLGMRKTSPARSPRPVLLKKTSWIRARSSGLFRARIRRGVRVAAGEVVATITDPFGESEIKVTSPVKGHVIGLNNYPIINQGDALLHIGMS